MPNTKTCGTCLLYHALIKPYRNGKGFKDTGKGHCLAQTVYAKNKPGSPVYPPRAKIADLPFNQHQVVVVRANEIRAFCMTYKEKKG